MYFSVCVFCRSYLFYAPFSHATSFSRLLCFAPTKGLSVFFLRPAEFGQSQLLAFVRSRATLKIPYLLRKIFFLLLLCPYQHVKSTSASPNTLDFCIWKLSVAASASGVLSPDPSR